MRADCKYCGDEYERRGTNHDYCGACGRKYNRNEVIVRKWREIDIDLPRIVRDVECDWEEHRSQCKSAEGVSYEEHVDLFQEFTERIRKAVEKAVKDEIRDECPIEVWVLSNFAGDFIIEVEFQTTEPEYFSEHIEGSHEFGAEAFVGLFERMAGLRKEIQ